MDLHANLIPRIAVRTASRARARRLPKGGPLDFASRLTPAEQVHDPQHEAGEMRKEHLPAEGYQHAIKQRSGSTTEAGFLGFCPQMAVHMSQRIRTKRARKTIAPMKPKWWWWMPCPFTAFLS